MVTFVPQFLTEEYYAWFVGPKSTAAPEVTIADVANHIEHARDVAGIGHIGLGSDFDGTDEFPSGLDGVDGYPSLLAELVRRGWSSVDLAALAGGNVLRVLRETDAAFADASVGVPILLR